MKFVVPHPTQRWFSLALFVIGLVATMVALNVPVTATVLRDLEQSGYFGALFAGIMYAISLTSATATVVFANIPDTLNPPLVALIGGFGAMLYDLSVFSLSRRPNIRERVEQWTQQITHHEKLPRWLSIMIGAFLIASPLPDELGATFFGFTSIPLQVFLPLSFGLNTIGILVITGVW